LTPKTQKTKAKTPNRFKLRTIGIAKEIAPKRSLHKRRKYLQAIFPLRGIFQNI
jgi:hypothetical protein